MAQPQLLVLASWAAVAKPPRPLVPLLPPPTLPATVTYDGASSFQALVEAAAEQFMAENENVSITGSGNGSGTGLTAVADGTVTIGNSDVFAETKLEPEQCEDLVDHEVAVVGHGSCRLHERYR